MFSLCVSSDVMINREKTAVTCNADSEVFGVLTLTLTHFLAKTIFFQRVCKWWVYIHCKTCGNSGEVGGEGGYFLCSKNGNSREEGRTCMKS